MDPSLDLSIFSPRPLQRRMYLLGCSCGHPESKAPVSQRQQDCFSYVVSIDGVHVCHPQNIVEYESAEEDEPEINSQNLVEHEGTGEVETESNFQNLVEHEDAPAATPERECPFSLLQRRGRSISRMHLALTTSSSSTLINLHDESSNADHPDAESDPYELIKQIGIDGEGVIHLMRSRSTRQLIVRKTVSYARSLYAKPIEAAILEDILPDRHNNIIRLHAFELYQTLDSPHPEGARYYFEYCPGGDLHQFIDQYEKHDALLPELFIWQAYQQLLSALEFLHRGFDPRCTDPNRRGVCHRDIKPSNIFLRFHPDASYPDVVLADFGHATLNFATYDPAGTAFWQPPELPRHSPKGDVYSLGAVVHFMIHFDAPVAEMPSDGSQSERDEWASAPQARRPRMEFVNGYSEELVCLMLIALEPDENKRKSASQLLKWVDDCVERMFPSGEDLLAKAEEWPMARWAFDHVVSAGGRFGEEEEEEEEVGTEQYFEMMKWFGCARSRESSRSSSSALSDWRRGVDGRSSRG